ncbi:hypothetical protein NKG05_01140 [Oerskovia sp. M15]
MTVDPTPRLRPPSLPDPASAPTSPRIARAGAVSRRSARRGWWRSSRPRPARSGGLRSAPGDPPPSEPVPDAQETLRREAVWGAQHAGELAVAAGATSSGLDAAGLAALADTSAFAACTRPSSGSTTPGSRAGATSGATDEPTAPASATPAEVVDALAASTTDLRTAVDLTEDGSFARLLASVAASQDASARQVAASTGTRSPSPWSPRAACSSPKPHRRD